MNRKTAVVVCVSSLVAGAIFGYLGGYLGSQRTIENLEAEVASLGAQAAGLTVEVNRLEQNVATQLSKAESLGMQIVARVAEIATLKSEHTAEVAQLETEKASLASDLGETRNDLTAAREQVASQATQLTSTENRLDTVLGISVTQHYAWNYQRQEWTWDLPISLSTYVGYMERPRPTEISSYVDLARDLGGSSYIDGMVAGLNEFATDKGYTETQKLNFMVSFVQSLPYTVDSVTTLADEYPRYPVETLFDRGGDCEDTSILVAALLNKMGYDVALLHLPGHMAVGVALPAGYGSYYNYDGRKYYYLETTGEGWGIGDMPNEYLQATAYIYPLES